MCRFKKYCALLFEKIQEVFLGQVNARVAKPELLRVRIKKLSPCLPASAEKRNREGVVEASGREDSENI